MADKRQKPPTKTKTVEGGRKQKGGSSHVSPIARNSPMSFHRQLLDMSPRCSPASNRRSVSPHSTSRPHDQQSPHSADGRRSLSNRINKTPEVRFAEEIQFEEDEEEEDTVYDIPEYQEAKVYVLDENNEEHIEIRNVPLAVTVDDARPSSNVKVGRNRKVKNKTNNSESDPSEDSSTAAISKKKTSKQKPPPAPGTKKIQLEPGEREENRSMAQRERLAKRINTRPQSSPSILVKSNSSCSTTCWARPKSTSKSVSFASQAEEYIIDAYNTSSDTNIMPKKQQVVKSIPWLDAMTHPNGDYMQPVMCISQMEISKDHSTPEGDDRKESSGKLGLTTTEIEKTAPDINLNKQIDTTMAKSLNSSGISNLSLQMSDKSHEVDVNKNPENIINGVDSLLPRPPSQALSVYSDGSDKLEDGTVGVNHAADEPLLVETQIISDNSGNEPNPTADNIDNANKEIEEKDHQILQKEIRYGSTTGVDLVAETNAPLNYLPHPTPPPNPLLEDHYSKQTTDVFQPTQQDPRFPSNMYDNYSTDEMRLFLYPDAKTPNKVRGSRNRLGGSRLFYPNTVPTTKRTRKAWHVKPKTLWKPHKATIFFNPNDPNELQKQLPETYVNQAISSNKQQATNSSQTYLGPDPSIFAQNAFAQDGSDFPNVNDDIPTAWPEDFDDRWFPSEHKLGTSSALNREMTRLKKQYGNGYFHRDKVQDVNRNSLRMFFNAHGWYPFSTVGLTRIRYRHVMSHIKRQWYLQWSREVNERNAINQENQIDLNSRPVLPPIEKPTKRKNKYSRQTSYCEEGSDSLMKTSKLTDNNQRSPDMPQSNGMDPVQYSNAPDEIILDQSMFQDLINVTTSETNQDPQNCDDQRDCDCRSCFKAANWVNSEGSSCYPSVRVLPPVGETGESPRSYIWKESHFEAKTKEELMQYTLQLKMRQLELESQLPQQHCPQQYYQQLHQHYEQIQPQETQQQQLQRQLQSQENRYQQQLDEQRYLQQLEQNQQRLQQQDNKQLYQGQQTWFEQQVQNQQHFQDEEQNHQHTLQHNTHGSLQDDVPLQHIQELEIHKPRPRSKQRTVREKDTEKSPLPQRCASSTDPSPPPPLKSPTKMVNMVDLGQNEGSIGEASDASRVIHYKQSSPPRSETLNGAKDEEISGDRGDVNIKDNQHYPNNRTTVDPLAIYIAQEQEKALGKPIDPKELLKPFTFMGDVSMATSGTSGNAKEETGKAHVKLPSKRSRQGPYLGWEITRLERALQLSKRGTKVTSSRI